MKSKILTMLLSLAVAIIMWSYVINFQHTQIEHTVYNIEVKMIGESGLQDRGLMISSISDRTVDLTLYGRRSDISKLKPSDITVLVDLSSIHGTGEKRMSYEVTFPSNLQGAIEIVDQSPVAIDLTVAQWDTKNIPINVELSGKPASDYLIDKDNITTSLKQVDISGPMELVEQIAMAKVYANMDGATGTLEQQLELVFCDKNGQPLSGDMTAIAVETRKVVTKVPVLMEKRIDVLLPIVAGGGLTAGDVTLTMSFDKITVTGSPAVVSKMSAITLEPIKLSVETSSFEKRKYSFTLPSGVTSREGTIVDVSLKLPPTSTRTISVPREQFEAVNLPEGYEVNFTTQYLTVTLQGRLNAWQEFKESDIRVLVDVSKLITEGQDYATGECPATIVVGNGTEIGAVEDISNPYELYVLVLRTA